MARKTSFYYSFLVLPADQRHAIIAVWDFCRAVDDAVDEAEGEQAPDAKSPREALAYWRAELARCYDDAQPQSPQGRSLQPFVREFDLPRQAFEDVIDGVAMDLDRFTLSPSEITLDIHFNDARTRIRLSGVRRCLINNLLISNVIFTLRP